MDKPQLTGTPPEDEKRSSAAASAELAEAAFPSQLTVAPGQAGVRLDQFLAASLPEVSRVRVRQLLERQQILLNGKPAKPSARLKGGEHLAILGRVQPEPLRAMAEDIPLAVVYEDGDLAVIDKPAGMRVHAGAGSGEAARGTLVNALLHRFGALSQAGGELRPGIVHRLDKDTSGLIVVAKNDPAHRRLAAQFAGRQVSKRYLALVHGWPRQETGTVSAAISRDRLRRTRMTTRLRGGRTAVSHFKVLERLLSPYGRFALLEVKIETGRTHQIRVHLSSIGHPVVGDTLYGAPRLLSPQSPRQPQPAAALTALALTRNFLHAAELEFSHPRSGKRMRFESSLPAELEQFLSTLRHSG